MTEHNRDAFEIAFVAHVCGIDAEAAKRKVEWLNGEGLMARHSAAYDFAYCQQSTNDAWWAWQEAQARIMSALDRMTDQRDQLAAQLRDATAQLADVITQRDKLLSVAYNFRIKGPDEDGLTWLSLPGNQISACALFNLGPAERLAVKVALHLEAERQAAIAETLKAEGR